MNTDLNKKTVKELRKRARELHEEGVIDETLTEISKARKAELIEWIEFYDDEDEELQEDELQHQVIAAKTRTAIESFPVSEDAKPPFSGSHEDELENKSEDPQTSETVNPGVGEEALGEVLMLIVVGLLTLGTAIGLGYIFR